MDRVQCTCPGSSGEHKRGQAFWCISLIILPTRFEVFTERPVRSQLKKAEQKRLVQSIQLSSIQSSEACVVIYYTTSYFLIFNFISPSRRIPLARFKMEQLVLPQQSSLPDYVHLSSFISWVHCNFIDNLADSFRVVAAPRMVVGLAENRWPLSFC